MCLQCIKQGHISKILPTINGLKYEPLDASNMIWLMRSLSSPDMPALLSFSNILDINVSLDDLSSLSIPLFCFPSAGSVSQQYNHLPDLLGIYCIIVFIHQ